jgi:hypothetical protein
MKLLFFLHLKSVDRGPEKFIPLPLYESYSNIEKSLRLAQEKSTD